MFPRVKSFKNKDGSWRHYLYLVATKRSGGRVRQQIMANLGRVEEADKILPDVVAKLAKFSKKLKVINLAKDIQNDWVKEYGAVIVFKRIWEQLEIAKYFTRYQRGRKLRFNVGEVVFSMVLNRLLEPQSELGMHHWIDNVYGAKEVTDLNQWYRALDFLTEHKDRLEIDLYEEQRDLFKQEIDMVLMDTTSVVYWGEGEQAEDILEYGYSKEKRFDLKQIIVGILMSKEGRPIGHEVYPGNTNDLTAFREMIKKVNTRFKIRRVVIVCDRGMVSTHNIRQLELNDYEYIMGVRMRQLKKQDAKRFLFIKGMKTVSKGLQGKEVVFENKRYVVCFNEKQAKRDKTKREEIIKRLQEKLKDQGLKSLLIHKEYSKYLKIKADKPELDREKVKAEEIYDGKFILQSNTALDWKEIVLAYKDLWQVESAFRTLKNELAMGPIYHYTERRIRAHIFVCFLALALRVILSKNLNDIAGSFSYNKIIEDLKKIKAVQITIKDKPLVIRTELQGDAHYAFKAVGLKIPPRLLSDSSEIEENVVVCA